MVVFIGCVCVSLREGIRGRKRGFEWMRLFVTVGLGLGLCWMEFLYGPRKGVFERTNKHTFFVGGGPTLVGENVLFVAGFWQHIPPLTKYAHGNNSEANRE